MSEPSRRPLPDGIGATLPVAGRLLAVLVTSPTCVPCRRVRDRLDRLEGIDIHSVDASEVDAPGFDRVPHLWLVDAAGDVVRDWVGEPLAGVLERTVAQSLSP